MHTRDLAVAVMIVLTGVAASAVAGTTDEQVWFDQWLQGPLAENVSVNLKQQQRWVNDVGELGHYHVELGVTWKTRDWLSLATGFRQQFVKRGEDWAEEYRPVLTATLNGAWGKVKWKDRSRVEFRFRDGRDTIVAYRNQFAVDAPVSWTRAKIKPYAFDEIFFDSDQGELHTNRFVIGVKAAPTGPVRLALYGMWQTRKAPGDWNDDYILGARLGLAF